MNKPLKTIYNDGSVIIGLGFEILQSLIENNKLVYFSFTVSTRRFTLLGKTIVTNFCKLIPGAGSVVGGVISAATAAILTSALGEAYIMIMTMIAKGEVSPDYIITQEGMKEIARIFVEKIKLERNEDGTPKRDN